MDDESAAPHVVVYHETTPTFTWTPREAHLSEHTMLCDYDEFVMGVVAAQGPNACHLDRQLLVDLPRQVVIVDGCQLPRRADPRETVKEARRQVQRLVRPEPQHETPVLAMLTQAGLGEAYMALQRTLHPEYIILSSATKAPGAVQATIVVHEDASVRMHRPFAVAHLPTEQQQPMMLNVHVPSPLTEEADATVMLHWTCRH